MFIITHRKIFYTLSAVIIALSIFAVLFWGINFGIDFTGGSLLEVDFTANKPAKAEVENIVASIEDVRPEAIDSFSIRETGESGYILRSKVIDDTEKNLIVESLQNSAEGRELTEVRFNNIGPTLGNELRSKALVAIIVIVVAIILFVAFAFRHVSKPVSSWKYGLVAIFAFVHDVMVPIGLFAVLGHFFAAEIDTLFVIAILVVLGYSINDTIVVFDRIRENLKDIPENHRADKFEAVVGKSLRQTIARSINTSITTLVALLALFFFGGDTTKWFALALIAGVIAGTYSSIFFASPMLVSWSKKRK